MFKLPITNFVNMVFDSGKIPYDVLEAFITLIPKKERPENASDFRLITILNIIYKIVTKVLVNRLRPFMKEFIGSYQNSFLRGRSTLDNIILTQEIVHGMNRKKEKKGAMILKLDLQKTYYSLDWDFLDLILKEFEFPAKFVKLVMSSVKENWILIIWNGENLPPICPGRGLRHGDPLAPYLFIIAMEKLSRDILEEVEKGHWKPIRVTQGRVGVSHLFFAYDLIIFSEA